MHLLARLERERNTVRETIELAIQLHGQIDVVLGIHSWNGPRFLRLRRAEYMQ